MHFTLLAPPVLTNRRKQKSIEHFQVLKLPVSIILYVINQSMLNYKHMEVILTSTRDTYWRLNIFINARNKFATRSLVKAS